MYVHKVEEEMSTGSVAQCTRPFTQARADLNHPLASQSHKLVQLARTPLHYDSMLKYILTASLHPTRTPHGSTFCLTRHPIPAPACARGHNIIKTRDYPKTFAEFTFKNIKLTAQEMSTLQGMIRFVCCDLCSTQVAHYKTQIRRKKYS